MSQSRLEGKVGLFLFFGILLLIALLLSFSKGTNWFTPTYELRLKTTRVGGIKDRAGVLLAGVQVGGVHAIELVEGGKRVVLRLRILKRYPIYKDAKFTIEQIGVLGDQFVAIYPQENAGPLLFHNGGDRKGHFVFQLNVREDLLHAHVHPYFPTKKADSGFFGEVVRIGPAAKRREVMHIRGNMHRAFFDNECFHGASEIN